jgi:hypothetical protein
MIRKSVERLCEKIMRKQGGNARAFSMTSAQTKDELNIMRPASSWKHVLFENIPSLLPRLIKIPKRKVDHCRVPPAPRAVIVPRASAAWRPAPAIPISLLLARSVLRSGSSFSSQTSQLLSGKNCQLNRMATYVNGSPIWTA